MALRATKLEQVEQFLRKNKEYQEEDFLNYSFTLKQNIGSTN